MSNDPLDELEISLSKSRAGNVDEFLVDYWKGISKIIKSEINRYCRPQRNVLDLGCGQGDNLRELALQGMNTYGIDPLVNTSLRPAKEKDDVMGVHTDYVRGVGESIPFRDESFDMVICLSTFQHVADQEKTIDEITRVLRPDGALICSVPSFRSFETLFRWMDVPYYVTRKYDYVTFRRFFLNNGFEVQKIITPGFFPPLGVKVMQRLYSSLNPTVSRSILNVSYMLGQKLPKAASNIIVVCTKRAARSP